MTATGARRTGATFGSAVEIRRLVNDSIREVARRFDGESPENFDFLCECGDLGCRTLVTLTLADYEASVAGSVLGHPADEVRTAAR